MRRTFHDDVERRVLGRFHQTLLGTAVCCAWLGTIADAAADDKAPSPIVVGKVGSKMSGSVTTKQKPVPIVEATKNDAKSVDGPAAKPLVDQPAVVNTGGKAAAKSATESSPMAADPPTPGDVGTSQDDTQKVEASSADADGTATGAKDTSIEASVRAASESTDELTATAEANVATEATGASEAIQTSPVVEDGAFSAASQVSMDPPVPSDLLTDEFMKPSSGTASQNEAGPVVPEAMRPRAETATFKHVRPGESTVAQLKEAWGEPVETFDVEGGVKYVYAMPPFREATALVQNDVVTSLVISLEQPLPAGHLTQQLDLAEVRSVDVPDEFGTPLGQVFPERGVLFGYAPDSNRGVGHVILEPVDIQPFLWRAEVGYRQHLLSALADLDFVLERRPETDRAHWLRARVLGLARYDEEALAAAAEAVRLAPETAEYHITYARQLEQSGDTEQAAAEVQRAIELAGEQPEVKGKAVLQQADMAASGAKPDYARSVELRREAIKLCLPLSEDRRVFVRDEANEVLFDAYLGLARDIAWGNWNRKPAVVPRWLSEANKLGQRLAEQRDGGDVYQFAVARAALDASVGMEGRLRVDPFVELAARAGDALAEVSDDAWTRARWQWETGLALFDATQVYQLANRHADALRYGKLAVEHLEHGSAGRTESPLVAMVLGQAQFRVGSIYAVANSDHHTAVTWFERAAPLLERPLPAAAQGETGTHGERFVSMGVSYWETGARQEAIRLTKEGTQLMERAVELGLMDRHALAVPLNNLALMHRGMGKRDEADEFERTAARLSGSLKR
ncbi:MAG: hypothetical protein R3C10_01860 [Pirellulales bacterium]